MLVSLRRNITPISVIQKMEQVAAEEAANAAKVAAQTAAAAERMAKIRISGAKLTSQKTGDELLRHQTAEAIAQSEARSPLRRSHDMISPDIVTLGQMQDSKKARYLVTIGRKDAKSVVLGKRGRG